MAPPTSAEAAIDRRNLLLLGLLWLAAVLLVGPGGDFPVLDDWAYAESVRILVGEGRLHWSDWDAANMLTHFLWGSLFAWPLGGSYVVLRLSTLVAALLGAGAFYRLLRLDGADPRLARLGAATLLLNPLSLGVSFTYMTDIPYAAAQTGALLLLAEGARTRSRVRTGFGWALGLVALLSRQIGVAVPVGWAAGRWNAARTLAVGRLARLLLPLVLFGIVQLAFGAWLRASGLAPVSYGRNMDGGASRFVTEPLAAVVLAGKMVPKSFYYFGLLALPVTLAAIPAWLAGWPVRQRRRWLIGMAVALVLLLIVGEFRYVRFPTWLNTLLWDGIGNDYAAMPAPVWLRAAVAWIAALGGVLVVVLLGVAVANLAFRRPPAAGTEAARFDMPAAAACSALALLVAVMTVKMRFDRYFIPMLPSVLLLAASTVRGRALSPAGLRVGTVTLAVMSLISVAAVHDTMATKRVQWQAYREVAARVPPRLIDGGWVYNAPANYRRHGDPLDIYTWFERADWIVKPGTDPLPGYVAVARYPIPLWLRWPGSMPILVQRRAAAAAPPIH